METNKTLNIDTFNEILFGALKDQSPKGKVELLAMELEAAYAMKIQYMEAVIEDLNTGKPYHENLELVNNVDSNLDRLGERMDAIKKAHPEIFKSDGGQEGTHEL